jgi:glycolate oxidase FAD binding subunit
MSSAASCLSQICRGFDVETGTLDVETPGDEREAAEAIRRAIAQERPLSIVGHGSKAALGRSTVKKQALSTRRLAGVTLYEPQELVLSAGAGTPLQEIVALLEAQGQQLAFEPIDYALLLGGASQNATLGGMIAVNASGPRRIKSGAARDHVLGFRCVTGRGDIVKSGGRVMKNVTGYDLSKLVTGSFGTFALLTELTLKVLPKPETEQTLLALGLGEPQNLALLRRVSATPYEVSSFAVATSYGRPTAALRLEGPEISVVKRRVDLMARLKDCGARFEILDEGDSRAFWSRLRDAAPVAAQDGQVWRISVAPTDGYALVESLRRKETPIVSHFYDWAGGLVWLCLEPAADAHAAAIRAEVVSLGGHATLIRASDEIRARVDVFHPQPAALAALTRRVKESFDPAHILERGRMRAEF